MTCRPDAADARAAARTGRARAHPSGPGRPRLAAAFAGVALALALGGCSGSLGDTLESVARPFDPAPPAEPERVSTGQDAAQEDYPNLAEVPDEPPRRPSDRQSREQMRDSLSSDRQNARYSDQPLRGEGTDARQTPAQAPEPADVEMPADDAGAGGGDQLADGEAMTLDETGRTRRATSDSGRSAQTGRSAEATPSDGGRGRRGDNTADSGGTRQLPADVPQIQPSQQGEPIRLPDAPQFDGQNAGGAAAPSRDARQQQAQAPSAPAAASGRSQAFQRGDPGRTAGEPAGQRLAVIYFGHGSTGLDGRDREVLRQVAQVAQQRQADLRVVGHASSRTAAMDLVDHRMANLETSMKRAEAVADALVSMGVARGRIQVEGRADRDKVYHEFMPTGEAGNRRAEVFLQ